MAKSEKLGEAHVDITGRLSPLKRSMIRAKSIVKSGMKTLVTIVKRGAIVLGVAVAFNIYKMIRAASAAEEIQAKFGTVFKELTQQANMWAQDYAKSVGRATQDVKKWMAGLQDLFVPLGMTRQAALKLDKSLVKLAVDVASFNNQADEDVIRDFTSALVGNHETVRKYGIIISEVALKQEALNQGIKKSYKELTNLEKVQLRYELIMRGSTDAQGDAIRTSASFANQMKRLKASITDFWEVAGAKFLPQVTAIVTKMNEWLKVNGDMMAQNFGGWIDDLGKKLKNVSLLFEQLRLDRAKFKVMVEQSRFGKDWKAEWSRAAQTIKEIESNRAARLKTTQTRTKADAKKEALKEVTAQRDARRKYFDTLQARLAARGATDIPGAPALPADIATKERRASFIPLMEMWKTLSGGTQKISERMLDVNQRQLDETKRMREAIESGFEKQKQGWVP